MRQVLPIVVGTANPISPPFELAILRRLKFLSWLPLTPARPAMQQSRLPVTALQQGAGDYGSREERNMDMNPIGKFEMREILNEFDATLIRLFGVNMLDAAISRYEALEAYSKVRCPRKAAELSGLRLGLKAEVV